MSVTNELSQKARDTAADQGWNDHSLAVLLLRYARTLGGHSDQRLEEFLAEAADEENQGSDQI